MIVAAFLVTALAAMVIGIWLSARAAKGHMSVNPVKVWAFIDSLKQKTIESYVEELSTALDLKYQDDKLVAANQMTAFIREYTADVLEKQKTRR